MNLVMSKIGDTLIIKSIVLNLENDNAKDLCEVLDAFKGSYAVEYFLKAFLAKGNEHTLYSAIKFLEEIHDNNV